MRASRPEESDCGAANDFAWVSLAVRAALPDAANVAGRDRFLARVRRCDSARFGARCRVGAPGLAWGAGIVATATAGFALSHAGNSVNYARVGFEAAGGAVPENGYVSAGAGSDGSADRAVRFAGGSRIQFAPGSRGRISDSKVATPRVVLEAGRATVRGDANPREDLLVEAGPYAMKSDGGAFDVSWSGSVLEIRVASGAVVVEGPVARHGMTLYGDQAFVAREADGEVRCF